MTGMRTGDAGFTLIETLVALAVLAISAVGLLASTQAHISRIAALETRAAASWAAENFLAEVTLGLPPNALPPPMLGVQFRLDATADVTTDTGVQRLIISSIDTADARAYARLTGFVLTEQLAGQP